MDASTKRYVDQQIEQLRKEMIEKIKESKK